MNVLHLSSYDINGGAARAAYRLHQGLQVNGVQSQMYVQEKLSGDRSVVGPSMSLMQGLARSKMTLDILPLKLLYRQWQRSDPFSLQWLPDRARAQINRLQPDLINLHWVGAGFIQPQTLAQLRQPLVWTLHDMWAFTGGCHYSGECDRYRESCGSCPALHSHSEQDITRQIWRCKAKAWSDLNLTIVSPSEWLAKSAASSSLLSTTRIEVIPNGIDTQGYRPIAQAFARSLLRLPLDKSLLLFGAMNATSDPRKGFQLLQPALQRLSRSGWGDRLELVVLGASAPERSEDLGFKVHYLGKLSDDLSLAVTYSAIDAVAVPSLQDNLPNVILEAMSCGSPCIGFNLGGIPDMIDHQGNGYLAQPFSVEDLATGIAWVLDDPDRTQKLSQCARAKTELAFNLELQARRYQSLYQELLGNREAYRHSHSLSKLEV
ncbi:MAG: glycosyltransferase [Leptolyngbyaceae cyanobacterium CSU_1_4]|nr:glycosyltransferase [Leptolyngbyaceae cyanobacterium CSU_1_4]